MILHQKNNLNLFKKIAIIGCPGSGKSTLALALHKKLGIPIYHLDQYFWKPGWQRPDRAEFEKVHRELCDQAGLPDDLSAEALAQEEALRVGWIIEGVATRYFAYRAQKADVIIFLDIPLYICLWRIYKRAFTCFGQVRDSSAPGCPERLPDLEFLRYVLSFNRKYRPEIEAVLEQYKDQKRTFVVKNKADFDQVLSQLSTKH